MKSYSTYAFASIVVLQGLLHGPAIAADITTVAMVPVALDSINTTINNALDKGDYLTAKTGIEARMAIESWKAANKELLRDLSNKLTQQQQDFFSGIERSLQSVSEIEIKTASDVEQALEQTQQIIADVKFWDGSPAVIRSTPLVIHPNVKQDFPLVIRGINLDGSNVQVLLGKNKLPLNRIGLEKQEARFLVPKEVFTHDEKKLTTLNGIIRLEKPPNRFLAFFGKKAEYSDVQFSFVLLPKELGLVTIVSSKVEPSRNSSGIKTREFHYSRGSLDWSCETSWQRPSNDFKIDIDSIGVHSRPGKKLVGGWLKNLCVPSGGKGAACSLPGEWGESGKWRYVDKTELGFAVEVCAKRYFHGLLGTDTAPGYKHVIIEWKEYNDIDVEKKNPKIVEAIDWSTPIYKELPVETNKFYITAKLFNGKTEADIETFKSDYVEVKWDKSTKQVLVKPKVPEELSGLGL